MNEAKRKAQDTYNTAADHYDDPANGYWERYGRKTVERLELRPGSSVLDVACGAGASALPAAEIVGPSGRVVGIDLAENLLNLARTKAVARGLQNIEFRQDDMTQLKFDDGSFDAIVCAFGIFFAPEIEALVAELWRMLKPHGKLAITTWGPNLFEPMYTAFDTILKQERPDLVNDFRPWDRITTESAVEQLLRDGGATNIVTASEAGQQLLLDVDSWWKIVLGSGLRATVNAMGPELAEYVRLQNMTFIEERGVQSVTTNIVYGVAYWCCTMKASLKLWQSSTM